MSRLCYAKLQLVKKSLINKRVVDTLVLELYIKTATVEGDKNDTK